jgi:hypothetical protein
MLLSGRRTAVLASAALLGLCGPALVRAQTPAGGAPPGESATRQQLQKLQDELDQLRKQLDAKDQTIQKQAARIREASARGPAGAGPRVRGRGPRFTPAPLGGAPAGAADATGPSVVAPPTPDLYRGKGVEDNVELLQAQLDVRKAYLAAATQEEKIAKTRLDRVARLFRQRAAPAEEYEEARAAVLLGQTKVVIRQGELKEAEVLLQQAQERRKKRPAAGKTEDRLLELEKKLAELLEEVRGLRGRKAPAKP